MKVFTRTLARIAREFIPLLAALARTMKVFTRTLARCARSHYESLHSDPRSLRSRVYSPYVYLHSDLAFGREFPSLA